MISLPKLNYEDVLKQISNFLFRALENAKAEGYVVGVSGGIDSSVSATLAARSLGNKVKALIMPEEGITPIEDIKDAKELCESFNIEYKIIPINQIKESYLKNLGFSSNIKAIGNLSARIRMSILYYFANSYNLLVLGTGDKSEILIGYFTKYGDGGVDVLPIGDLYKTQVRELGRYLGLSERIVNKKSSPRLWAGQEAESELGISYELLDKILYGLVELELDSQSIANRLNIDIETVRRIKEIIRINEHKRKGPIICQINLKAVGAGFKLPAI
jgi:NAD+ synthase